MRAITMRLDGQLCRFFGWVADAEFYRVFPRGLPAGWGAIDADAPGLRWLPMVAEGPGGLVPLPPSPVTGRIDLTLPLADWRALLAEVRRAAHLKAEGVAA